MTTCTARCAARSSGRCRPTPSRASAGTRGCARCAAARERVFLSALSDGDFFGEFSFLTRRPRSASVEAVTECRLLEVSRQDAGAVLDEDPSLQEPILAFYKERVVEWMLAKNAVFS